MSTNPAGHFCVQVLIFSQEHGINSALSYCSLHTSIHSWKKVISMCPKQNLVQEQAKGYFLQHVPQKRRKILMFQESTVCLALCWPPSAVGLREAVRRMS